MIWDALYIGKAIYAACKNISGVSLRVYPLRIPQEVDLMTSPALSYYITSVTPEDTKDSRSLCDTVVFQVSIFGSTYTLVTGIAQSVRDALDGLSGENSAVSIDYMRFEGWADEYENDTKLFHKAMEFSCRVKNDASSGTSYPYNDNSNIISALNLTADYTWTNAIPTGYLIESFIFEESGGASGLLSCGTSVYGYELFTKVVISPNALTVVNIDKILSKTTAATIYIWQDKIFTGIALPPPFDWTTQNITIYVMLRKIV